MTSFDYEIGLDLHKDFSMLALVNSEGDCLRFDRLEHNVTHLDHYFRSIAGTYRVTFESTRNWYWLADYLQERGIDFIMSNPALNRAIAHVHAKNDKYDARTLAQLTRAGLIGRSYVPPKPIRTLRELLYHRIRLLHVRTKLKNRIHVTLAKYNHQAPYQYIFDPHGRQWIRECEFPSAIKHIVDDLLSLIDELNPRIDVYYNRIKDVLLDHPYYRIVSSAYASGSFMPQRSSPVWQISAASRRLKASLGTAVGHMTRQSDKYLRTAFVEASYLMIRHDAGLRAFYDYLRAQKGHGCAICAVARKLARSVYFMLKNGTPYRVRRIQPKYLPTVATAGTRKVKRSAAASCSPLTVAADGTTG